MILVLTIFGYEEQEFSHLYQSLQSEELGGSAGGHQRIQSSPFLKNPAYPFILTLHKTHHAISTFIHPVVPFP